MAPQTDVRLDLRRIGMRDDSVDLLVATGVLTCVDGLACAVSEMYRVIRRGGTALLCEPVCHGLTSEWDPQVFAARRKGGGRRSFGTADAQKVFAPFSCEVRTRPDCLQSRDWRRLGLAQDDFAFIRLDK